jgi:predicted amidohydrolase
VSRKARICTISMNSLIHSNRSSKEDRFRDLETKMRQGSFDKPDLFLLPEICLINDIPGAFADPASIEEPGNATYERLGATARSYNAYIAAPLLTRDGDAVHNSTVLFNRSGAPVFTYHKTFPTSGELKEGISPGARWQPAFDADFGRLGFCICYDLNFQPLFKHYYSQGIEVLLFSSYFPGGLLLQTWSYLYMWHAVSSHAQGDESVFLNNTGHIAASANMFTGALTHEFELDCVAVPYWGNHVAIWKAKEKYGPAFEIENHRAEGDAILRYHGAETTAKDIIREYGIRTREDIFCGENLV